MDTTGKSIMNTPLSLSLDSALLPSSGFEFSSPVQLLAGDIGGTKTILRLVEVEVAQPCGHPSATLMEREYPSRNYPDLVPIVREFLGEAQGTLGKTVAPLKACFAIAGPVVGNACQLTNLSWSLTGDRLAGELELQEVALINDFVAVGYGVLDLELGDQVTLQAGTVDPQAPIAVIGAGTGLGEAFVVPQSGGGYRVYGTEGGHGDFAPRSVVEFELLEYLRQRLQIERVSVERVVSGQGIQWIYEFLRDVRGFQEHDQLAQVMQDWAKADSYTADLDPSAAIARGARELGDPLCQATMAMFWGAYGAEAGNLALKLLPYGGIYLAGGVAAKNLDLLQQGEFLQAFCHKGRMRSLLEAIPVHVIINRQVGLMGAAFYAAQM